MLATPLNVLLNNKTNSMAVNNMSIDYQTIILAVASMVVGWFTRSVLDRIWNRADSDHDKIVRLETIMEERDRKLSKDLRAAHDKIRQLNGGNDG